jgi:hypothetical protein
LDLGSKYPSLRIGSEQKSNRFWRGSEQPIDPFVPRRKRNGEKAG